ncbi:adhesion G protein-coupled receptor E1-like [Callorhinchus milii]|uniref:adhesion G protein-coupled receptor E1-like n=1 Tax=Callorhinchus milii TaxID=7868 RepID=UPI001C3FC4C5|nr:adhesion G protein-coupled receptor E1-like [Callorhinchus milii]
MWGIVSQDSGTSDNAALPPALPYSDSQDYIEECKSITCGPNTTCHNTEGAFYCMCDPGFATSTGNTTFVNTTTVCEDLDECKSNICGTNATCHNTVGAFYCTCDTTFVSTTGEASFTNGTTHCEHFDCLPDVNKHDAIIGERCDSSRPVGFRKNPQLLGSEFCPVIEKIFHLADEFCQNFTRRLALENVTSFASDLVGRDELWNSMETDERMQSANAFLTLVEKSAIAAALDLPDQGVRRNQTEIMEVEVRMFRGEGTSERERVRLQARNNTMDIFRDTVTGGKTTGFGAVSFIAYRDLDAVLNGTEFIIDGKTRHFYLASEVISASLSHRTGHTPHQTVNFTLRHKESWDRGLTSVSDDDQLEWGRDNRWS